MKRAAFLHCVGIDAGRYKVLRQRNQLPFEMFVDDEAQGKQANFTLEQAFRLRLMLDLIGGELDENAQVQGIGPTYAAKVVADTIRHAPYHPLNWIMTLDLWCGVLVLEHREHDGDPHRYSTWLAGPLKGLDEHVEKLRDLAKPGTQLVRIFLANATRAADFVRDRAAELGIPEGDDFSEIVRTTPETQDGAE